MQKKITIKKKETTKAKSIKKVKSTKKAVKNIKNQITGDMTISDIVQKYPQAAEVFLQYGLHCIGCHVSTFESLADGARSHGMSEEEIDMMIRDANTTINDPQHQASDDKNIIHMTPKAISKIKSFLKTGEKKSYFRIGLQEGGCSGYSYVFSIDSKISKDDITFEKDGLKCAVSKKFIESLKGVTIDYIETLQESGFKVNNPNATQSCGCGNSFS